MKKRLLITSIVMMLVVAVAISTATYAWFTSNATVTADQVTLTAATMNADAIMISKSANNTGLATAVDLATASNALYPTTPNAADALTAPTAAKFKNLLIDGNNHANVTALPESTASYYTDTVYIYNKGSQDITLDVTITITYGTAAEAAEAANSVRIAVIEQKGTAVSSSNVTLGAASLKAIYEIDTATPDDNTTPTLYTATTKKASASDTYGATADSNAAKGAITFSQNAFVAIDHPASGEYVCNAYTVVMWLEGWDAQCTNAASAGQFNVALSFAKASA